MCCSGEGREKIHDLNRFEDPGPRRKGFRLGCFGNVCNLKNPLLLRLRCLASQTSILYIRSGRQVNRSTITPSLVFNFFRSNSRVCEHFLDAVSTSRRVLNHNADEFNDIVSLYTLEVCKRCQVGGQESFRQLVSVKRFQALLNSESSKSRTTLYKTIEAQKALFRLILIVGPR